MKRFASAKEEFYCLLYERFMADDGPFCGKQDLDGLKEINPLTHKVILYARDLGHIAFNRFGGARLTAAGVDYCEKEFLGD